MTLDDEKDSVPRFLLKCNVSACYQRLSNKTDQPWITVCGHIFCASCGAIELGKLPATCPICCHQLTSPYDIIQSELNPPSHFIEMVLMGLSPDDCLEAARRGISFWQNQSILQLNSSESNMQSTRSQIVEMQSHYEDKVAAMNREIFTLREECHRLKKQNYEVEHKKFSVSMDQSNLGVHLQQVEPFTTDKMEAKETVKKQSYPRPSIPLQQTRPTSLSNDNLPQRQFMGKF